MSIEELCEILNGYAFKSDNYVEEGVRIIRIANVQKGYIEDNTPVFCQYDNLELEKYMLMENDLLISLTGNVGRVALLTKEFLPAALNQRVACLRLKNKEVLKKYLFYCLSANGFEEKCIRSAKGVAQKNMSTEWLKKYKIPLYSSNEQIQIVRSLDFISRTINNRKKQLQKLDELIQARFVEMFGDPVENPKRYYVATLQELIAKGYITYHLDGNHGGNYPKSEEFVDKGVPYISANCIVNGRIDFSKAKYLTPKRASKLRKGIAQNEDVLFAHNATVGPTVVLHTDEEKVILGTSLTAYRCNKNKVMPNYLKAYMLSDGFVRQYWGEMKQTTRNQVPITTQKKYLFLVPPIDLQNQFADFVNQVHKSKVEIQQALEKTQLLFDSLMQQYFG